ncbi:MAG: CDP-archaeol synthase [Nitrospirota bacterium]|nr:CDP-archaeol synthase [Nitrospirota bacterium]MDH5585353.1 CDP-archaeol synthase [Nitrospirota bacterium]MDH5773665.1 CDP-archaeol synthase [Nitrospirota bacterium]
MMYLQLFILIIVANGAPIIGRWLLNERWAAPIDGGRVFIDGLPLLGKSKTYRGVVFAILVTTLVALSMGLSWDIGLMVSSLAMVGDCLSSFVKRRMALPSSARALGFDQIPESLLPLLGLWQQLPLTWVGIVATVGAFFILELGLSKILFTLHIRKRPY